MHSRNGSLKHRPQLPPTLPWGFTPAPDYFGSRAWHQPHSSYRVARLRSWRGRCAPRDPSCSSTKKLPRTTSR